MNSMLTALAAHRVFIIYRARDKSPIDPLHEFPNTDWANSNAQDRATWLLPHEAVAYAAMLGTGYGVGLVLHPELKIFCVDIDHGYDPATGEWSELAKAFFTRFAGCAIEVSMSLTGAHIFGRYTGEMPAHKSKNTSLGIELYHQLRYIALTGTNLVGDITHDATALIPPFIAQYFTQGDEDGNPADWREGPMPGYAGPTDDDVLLERALRSRSIAAVYGGGTTFKDLWEFNEEKISKKWPVEPNSKSGLSYNGNSADQALANYLAFWTGADCDRMLRLMQREDCGLRRGKWEDRADYLPRTILRACSWQKTFAGPTGAAKAVAAPALTHILHAPPALQTAPPPPALIAPPPPAADGSPTFSVPAIPNGVQYAAPAMGRGDIVVSQGQELLFSGYTYVEDIYCIMSPDGEQLDKGQFDIRFGGRTFLVTKDGQKPTDSAWDAFTKGVTEFPKVRGMYFEPREAPGSIIIRNKKPHINSWAPLEIEMYPGDVSMFRNHIRKLFPVGDDAVILESYLKFMMQHKGVKAMWWPFLQGIPGNGKSFISTTMEYCIGQKYTQSPTAANIGKQFNASLYGCLFVAIEDVYISEAKGSMWETLKPMITQTRLEIEPKGVDKVTREVCFNGILNSNHRDGIRKTADDRRIAPFFAAQQTSAHLVRDGLNADYFIALWSWAKNGGWSHVAHWLATDPIEDKYNPATRAIVAPETSSTRGAINAGLGLAEQELQAQVDEGKDGFLGGWVNSIKYDYVLGASGRARNISRNKRREIIEGMGYVTHPGLPDGRVPTPLADNTRPILYVREDHTTLVMTDANAIKGAYEAAQNSK